ncbi:MAG: Na+/H+ antiporter subunit E [Rhodobacterales bacterium RIFCSPHIGHO2_02_FULL_62_130]|jgi:multicomponent K+:H+ antiporter subunit E|nr:MAG: Na+/H+ antiporter subunit E [Rhodobacterales bacterium RIFCSPHIGHO2_02_FULL_62_130]OHC60936.1 MAG: Na+/H+ antiporter subunit E [Rhodobacterales bacterium RIFCSPHIGHO2_12_FULL_62_75]HCY99232.1 Na+/H+ antiporter subunit E [Rhodobacter sp.]
MMRRLYPHPYLSLLLVMVWLLLVNRLALGSLVMAAFLATVIPLLTSAYWPARPRLQSPMRLVAYVALVVWDIILANIQVAVIVLFKPADQIRSAWITVPLDLTSPEAITLLAGTITMTPGTITADFSADGQALLIHALHAPDPDAVRDDIKARYEDRLKRIFI